MFVSRSDVRGFKSPMTHRNFCNHYLITNVALGIFMTMRANKNLYSRLIHDQGRFQGGAQGARAPGPPPGGPPPAASGGGPKVRNDVKIADFFQVSSSNRNFFGALCAHIVSFLDFCRRRAPIFLGLKIWTEH